MSVSDMSISRSRVTGNPPKWGCRLAFACSSLRRYYDLRRSLIDDEANSCDGWTLCVAQLGAGACSGKPRRPSLPQLSLLQPRNSLLRRPPGANPTFKGMWPLNHLIAVGLTRNARYNGKASLTDEEVAAAQTAADRRLANSRAAAIPVADASSKVMKQTSLIIDPPNGQFPELTDYGKQLQAAMRSSYKPGQTVFDAIEDFATWDRCITRGMPVSMEPRNYNNGIKIVQSPDSSSSISKWRMRCA